MAAGTGARRIRPSLSRVHLPNSSISCTSVRSHSPFRVSVTVQLMGGIYVLKSRAKPETQPELTFGENEIIELWEAV